MVGAQPGERRPEQVDRGGELTCMAELEAIVPDYLQQAAIWNEIPAAGPCGVIAELRAALR